MRDLRELFDICAVIVCALAASVLMEVLFAVALVLAIPLGALVGVVLLLVRFVREFAAASPEVPRG